MTSAPHCLVLVGGVIQSSRLEWSTDLRTNAVGTATISLPLPLGAEVVPGATVAILAGLDDGADRRVFSGQVTTLPPSFDEGGAFAQIGCSGWEWLLDLRLKDDLMFAGGAPTSPVLLSSSVYHVGNSTVLWYADSTPDGLTVSRFVDPGVDARFVRLVGRQHGANSYRVEPDKDIRDFSRIEIWQDGTKRGYVNLPQSAERWDDALDYTQDANWEDFDVVVGGTISAHSAIEIRFVSGTKPGTSERDDYEVKGVTYQTAARMGLRQVFASILKSRGFGASGNGIPYRVRAVTGLHGGDVLLGGNGLITNGQVGLGAGDRAWSWITATAQLFGYAAMGNPDGIDVAELRGDPSARTPVLSIVQGVNLLSIKPSTVIANVVTDWTVLGASGSDENGEPFQYQSIGVGTGAPVWLLTDANALSDSKTSDLLVSDGLCQTVREILEVETSVAPLDVTLTIAPTNAVKLGDVVSVTSPMVGVDRHMWVTGVRHVFAAGGWWTDLDVHVSNGGFTAEADAANAPTVAPSTATRHVGAASVAWYARPTPDGTNVALPFSPGDAYRAVRVTGRVHGSNSYPSGSSPDTWSTMEVWQFGVSIGSAPLPHAIEHAEKRYDYTSDTHWTDFDVTIAADVADAAAEIRYLAGTANDASVDDFEIKSTVIELYSQSNEQGARPTGSVDWQAYQARRRWRWAS